MYALKLYNLSDKSIHAYFIIDDLTLDFENVIIMVLERGIQKKKWNKEKRAHNNSGSNTMILNISVAPITRTKRITYLGDTPVVD